MQAKLDRLEESGEKVQAKLEDMKARQDDMGRTLQKVAAKLKVT